MSQMIQNAKMHTQLLRLHLQKVNRCIIPCHTLDDNLKIILAIGNLSKNNISKEYNTLLMELLQRNEVGLMCELLFTSTVAHEVKECSKSLKSCKLQVLLINSC